MIGGRQDNHDHPSGVLAQLGRVRMYLSPGRYIGLLSLKSTGTLQCIWETMIVMPFECTHHGRTAPIYPSGALLTMTGRPVCFAFIVVIFLEQADSRVSAEADR